MSLPRLQAFCISLPERQDRRLAFTAAWAKMPGAEQIDLRFIPAIKPPAHALQGPARVSFCDMACAVSHRKAVAMADAASLEAVLVLEDDALPLEGQSLLGFLDGPLSACGTAWDTCNLGGCSAQWRPATPSLRAERLAPGIISVKGMVTTHAILYHQRCYEDIMCSVPTELESANFALMPVTNARPYDQWLGSFGRMITGDWPLFVQSGSSSDILGAPHGYSVADLIQKTYEGLRRDCP